MDLLCTIQNTFTFIGESSQRANRHEVFSQTVTLDWFIGVQKFENSVASSDSARSFMSHVDFVIFKCAKIQVSYVIFSANWQEYLRTVRFFDLGTVFLLYYYFGAWSQMFNFNVSCCDSTLVFVGIIVNTTYLLITPRAVKFG